MFGDTLHATPKSCLRAGAGAGAEGGESRLNLRLESRIPEVSRNLVTMEPEPTLATQQKPNLAKPSPIKGVANANVYVCAGVARYRRTRARLQLRARKRANNTNEGKAAEKATAS